MQKPMRLNQEKKQHNTKKSFRLSFHALDYLAPADLKEKEKKKSRRWEADGCKKCRLNCLTKHK